MGLTELPFEQRGRIFRSPMPFGKYDPEGLVYPAYRSNNISTIVLLAEDEECRKKAGRDLRRLYIEDGFDLLHLPIVDFGIPDSTEIEQALFRAASEAKAGRHIVIHCSAGVGRTGLFVACLSRLLLNLSGPEAIDWVRQYIPGAVETSQQRQFVNELIAEKAGSQ